MPVENEIKYLLLPAPGLLAMLRGMGTETRIEQVYVGPGCRIRRSLTPRDETLTFTFKKSLSPGENVEIECPISAMDFERLTSGSVASVRKRRFSVGDGDVHWDVDLFDPVSGRTLAMAEAEMPEGMAKPTRILPGLNPWIVREIDRGDDRFSSFSLCDDAHRFEMARAAWAGGCQ